VPDPPDILVISESPLWPPDQGFRVHGWQMTRALSRMGYRVRLASRQPTPDDAPADQHRLRIDWPRAQSEDIASFVQGWSGPGRTLRHRLARFEGVSAEAMAGVVALVRQLQPRVVIGVGLRAPYMLRGLGGMPERIRPKRIWYAGDDLAYFHLSCLRRDPITALPARFAAMAGHLVLETIVAARLDGVIGVSPLDAKLLRIMTRAEAGVCVPNGVDTDYFQPVDLPPTPRSAVFWGRMDFEPNVDAACWFAKEVWPRVRAAAPDAVFRVVGKNPTARVQRLTDLPGVEVTGPVPDVRPYAHGSAAVVLPMRCGGGIKNKLLEAAAMARPIVTSRRAVAGLDLDTGPPPVITAEKPDDWVRRLTELWNDTDASRALGGRARQWIEHRHTWAHAAGTLGDWLQRHGGCDAPTTPTDHEEHAKAA